MKLEHAAAAIRPSAPQSVGQAPIARPSKSSGAKFSGCILKIFLGCIIWIVLWAIYGDNLSNSRFEEGRLVYDPKPIEWSWDVKFGWFNHDIVVSNSSAFALKAVNLSVTLVIDGQPQTFELKTDHIDAGDSYTWSNVTSVPKERINLASSSASVSASGRYGSSQGPGVNKFFKKYR